MKRSTDEKREIERHKYFLSENQGHDVGWEFAEKDWDRQYGDQWRREHAAASLASVTTRQSATTCCQDTATTSAESTCCQGSATTSNESRAARAEQAAPSTIVRKDPPARSGDGGPLRWLWTRLFHQPS